jgi:hypothetical protein
MITMKRAGNPAHARELFHFAMLGALSFQFWAHVNLETG